MNPEVLTAKNWYWWLWLSPLLTIPSLLVIILNEPGYDLICRGDWRNCDSTLSWLVTGLIAIFGSALWHLVLLFPALNKQSDFVRWHGRQALLLAGIRTAIPSALLILDYEQKMAYGAGFILWSIPTLIAVWFFGTLWGQRQAARGDCALMRWTGRGAGLPLPTKMVEQAAAPVLDSLIHGNQEHRAAYFEGLSLLDQGKVDEAIQVFQKLLASDASPQLKVRVVEKLKQISNLDENLTADVLVAIFRFSHDPEQGRMALARLERLGLVEAL